MASAVDEAVRKAVREHSTLYAVVGTIVVLHNDAPQERLRMGAWFSQPEPGGLEAADEAAVSEAATSEKNPLELLPDAVLQAILALLDPVDALLDSRLFALDRRTRALLGGVPWPHLDLRPLSSDPARLAAACRALARLHGAGLLPPTPALSLHLGYNVPGFLLYGAYSVDSRGEPELPLDWAGSRALARAAAVDAPRAAAALAARLAPGLRAARLSRPSFLAWPDAGELRALGPELAGAADEAEALAALLGPSRGRPSTPAAALVGAAGALPGLRALRLAGLDEAGAPALAPLRRLQALRVAGPGAPPPPPPPAAPSRPPAPSPSTRTSDVSQTTVEQQLWP
eukprot:tig00020563_g11368.t1